MKSNHRARLLVALALGLFSCQPTPRPGSAPKAELHEDGDLLATFFDDDIPRASGGYSYSYGGKTRNKIVPVPGAGAVFAAYFDDDYSGVNISRGNSAYLDLAPYRNTGSLSFWIKGGPSAQKFMVGLMDNQDGGKKVQSKLTGDSYVVVSDKNWTHCRIPLKAFADDGVYWDDKQNRELSAKLDWHKITDFRVSINRNENKVAPGEPVTFFLDRIELHKTSEGIEDPDAYWEAFKSDAPTELVTDFSKWQSAWKAQHGTSADIAASVGAAPKNAPSLAKGRALKVDFKPGDWFDAFIEAKDAPGMVGDWSRHYGVTLWLYTDKPYQAFDFVIRDRDHEMFLTKVGAGRGWHQILVPFRSFKKFAYYQPPEAKQNNKLDLQGITQFGVKPGGDVPGTLYLAGIELSNARELSVTQAPAQLAAVFRADLKQVVRDIPDIYGANVGLWVPDLIGAGSLEAEKQLALGVVRYPGGLLSDEEDWRKTLKAKDGHVDTDEFLDWCQKIHCKPMFTANVGDGTPELAAAWVEYVNRTRHNPTVALWEIGNEIYGKWHRYYAKWGKDGGTAYGKAVRAYVKAMKAVDPSIKVSAVWMLNGPWNRAVFKEVADVIDAVSVHHYAQNHDSENDQGLLAVSGEVDALMRDVQQQLSELGVKGKRYEVWLSEWNSVDENPGPQILKHVNGLFIADYLGHLAQAPIHVANVWAMYNGRDKRFGDYGLLAPEGDVQGLNFRRPSYWAFRMLSHNLTGKLLSAKTDQELLSGWLSRRADGGLSAVFVNKNFDTDYETKLEVPGLHGEATVETLSVENSGGLLGSEATGKTHPSTGPKSQHVTLGNGSSLLVPKASIVSVRFGG